MGHGIRGLFRIAPANLPRLDSVPLDALVLVFTILIAAAAASIFGVLPALRTSRRDVVSVAAAPAGGPLL